MSQAAPRERLAAALTSEPSSYHELCAACRGIVDGWINSDFEYPSPLIDAFVSIDSQADRLRMEGSDDERRGFFEDFKSVFMSEAAVVREFLRTQA